MTIDEITELLREYEELKKTVHRTGLVSDQEARMDARARLCTPGNIKTLLDALKVDVKRVFTRKDVARALEQAATGHFVSMHEHFGGDAWCDNVPPYVFEAFHKGFSELTTALRRWHDSLPVEAASPKFKIGDTVQVIGGSRRPFKVHEIREYNDRRYVYAEQSGYGGLYEECLELVENTDEPPKPDEPLKVGDWVCPKDGTAYQIKEVAYPFEDGVAYYRERKGGDGGQSWRAHSLVRLDPASPACLYERRNRLGWSRAEAAAYILPGWGDSDIMACESDTAMRPAMAHFRQVYAAALSKAEQFAPECEPRFAPGDWVRHKESGVMYRVTRSNLKSIDIDLPEGGEVITNCPNVFFEEAEPIVVQGDEFEAWWEPGTKEINFKLRGSEDEPMPVPVALVRDLLEKIGHLV